jgi:4-hydroxy-3-methylbut-2-enyl diphosphate reductase
LEIIYAKTAGFCFGVKQAVDAVFKQIEEHKNDKIYTYGPIIHNEEVIKELEDKGVNIIYSKEELEAVNEGVIIIRSHGVAKSVYELLEKKNVKVVDATCPDVKKIHRIVEEESAKDKFIIIVGDSKHPEVQGIKGWVKGESAVISHPGDIEKLKNATNKRCSVVAQTTFYLEKFKDIVEIIEKTGYDISVLNTICNSTRKRQEEARRIAEEADAMIVIGDKQSSNTQKLFEICQNACKATYYIQTLEDLDFDQLKSVKSVGITAGASTPKTIIEEVQNSVRIII